MFVRSRTPQPLLAAERPPLVTTMKTTPKQHSHGFTLIEILVSLALLGILGLVASGFVLPLKITRDSSQESQALTYARSYVEILKSRWLDKNAFENKDAAGALLSPVTYGAPVAGTTATADIKLPDSTWKLVTNASSWAPGDTLRTVEVKVTPPNGKVYRIFTMVSHP
jgi:prepilin-type N-terminal cleavage/methylation domain-containing protein